MPTLGTELGHVSSAIQDTARGLREIPFVEFTTTLIREIMETLVDASIEQMEAYADLVATIASGLVDYQNKLIGTSTERANIAEEYLESILGITIVTGSTAALTINETEYNALKDLFSMIFIENGIDASGNATGITGITVPTTNTNTQLFFDEITAPVSSSSINIDVEVMRAFAIEKIKSEAKASYEKIETLLKMGLNRLVTEKVTIETKLTFHMDSSEFQSASENSTDTNYSDKSTTWGVGAFFRSSGTLKDGLLKPNKRLASGIVNRSYGGFIRGGYRSGKTNSSLKVKVINEKATAATNLNIDIMGSVKLEARSDYFPAYEPPTPNS